MPKLSSESALQSQLTMSLSHSRLRAGRLPYSPTESICIIFKKIIMISNVMRSIPVFATNIANNTAKTKNPIKTARTTTALAIEVIMQSKQEKQQKQPKHKNNGSVTR